MLSLSSMTAHEAQPAFNSQVTKTGNIPLLGKMVRELPLRRAYSMPIGFQVLFDLVLKSASRVGLGVALLYKYVKQAQGQISDLIKVTNLLRLLIGSHAGNRQLPGL